MANMDLNAPHPAERQVSRKIPYSFAKAKGVLLTHSSAEYAEVQVRDDAAAETLAEVRRALGVPLRTTLLPPEAFDKEIGRAHV